MSSTRKEEYSKYLKSARWKRKRIQALDYHGAECACCGSTNKIHIHHISYLNYPGNEKMTDLIPLCEYHHQLVHKLITELRERNKNTPTYNWLKASKEAIKSITSSKYKQKPKKKIKKKRVVKSKRKKTKKPKLTRNQRKALQRKKETKEKKVELKSLNHTKEPFLTKEKFDKLNNVPEFEKFAKKKK